MKIQRRSENDESLAAIDACIFEGNTLRDKFISAETPLKQAAEALAVHSGYPNYDATLEIRLEVSKTIIQHLKEATSSDNEAEAAEKLWETLYGLKGILNELSPGDLYGLIRAIENGLNRHSEAPKDVFVRAATAVMSSLERDKLNAMLSIGHGMRDALNIVKHSMDGHHDHGLKLGSLIAASLCDIIKKKSNGTGIADMVQRILLPSVFKNVEALKRGNGSLDQLLSMSLFHPSMEKQYGRFFERHRSAICLGEMTSNVDGQCPTVHGFFDALVTGLEHNPEAVSMISSFIDGYMMQWVSPNNNVHIHDASKISFGFLFVAMSCEGILKMQQKHPAVTSTILEVLHRIERHRLYQPTFDEGHLQYTWMQRLVQCAFASEASWTSIGEQSTKKRKTSKGLPFNEVSTVLMDISRVCLRLEHRTLTPFLERVLQLMTNDVTAASEFLRDLMKAFAEGRKWTPMFRAVLRTMGRTASLSTVISQSSVLSFVSEAVRRLPSLEIEGFLNMVVEEENNQGDDDRCDLHRVRLLETVVAAVAVNASNAFNVSQSFQKLMPSLKMLQSSQGTTTFFALLKLGQSINKRIQQCAEIHPLVSTSGDVNEMPVEALIDPRNLTQQDCPIVMDCLLHRLHHLYLSHASGVSLTDSILKVMKRMSHHERKETVQKLMTESFVPWIHLCSSQQLTTFLRRMLKDFQTTEELHNRLFRDPITYGYATFGVCWRSALFQCLRSELMKIEGIHPLTVFSLQGDASMDDINRRLRRHLNHCIESVECTVDVTIDGVLNLLVFAFKLPPLFLKEDRHRLECCLMALSTVCHDVRILKCFALFSWVDTVDDIALEQSRLVTAGYCWLVRYCKAILSVDASDDERASVVDAAIEAMTKRTAICQLTNCNTSFFHPVESLKTSTKKLLKSKALSISSLLDWLRRDILDASVIGGYVYVSSAVAWVRLFCEMTMPEQRRRCACIKGAQTSTWMTIIRKRLKSDTALPSHDAISSILQGVTSSVLGCLPDSQPFERWSTLLIGKIAKYMAAWMKLWNEDMKGQMIKTITPVLNQMQQLTDESASLHPHCFEGIAALLSTVAHLKQPWATPLDTLHLHLTLYTKLMEATDATPMAAQQPLFFGDTQGGIAFTASESGSQRPSIEASFIAFIASGDEALTHSIVEALLERLLHAESLASQFSYLQFLNLQLHHHRLKWGPWGSKLPGKIFLVVYRCFWDEYIRHVLLTLVERKKRKAVHMPMTGQEGHFSAVLCGFFRCFALCHAVSESLAQRTTIQIMRRIKRLLQTLHKRTHHASPHIAAPWFGEICEFMIAAVRHQKTQEAADALFPSFRAALESMLSLLLAWELTPDMQTEAAGKLEMRLGSVYAATAACPEFARLLPELLISFISIMDTLRTGQCTKHNPLKRHISHVTSHHPPALAKRTRRHASMIYGTLSPSQVKDVKTRVQSNPHLTSWLRSFENENAHYSGHDG